MVGLVALAGPSVGPGPVSAGWLGPSLQCSKNGGVWRSPGARRVLAMVVGLEGQAGSQCGDSSVSLGAREKHGCPQGGTSYPSPVASVALQAVIWRPCGCGCWEKQVPSGGLAWGEGSMGPWTRGWGGEPSAGQGKAILAHGDPGKLVGWPIKHVPQVLGD